MHGSTSHSQMELMRVRSAAVMRNGSDLEERR
jgi:hypothetical protein